VPHVTPSPADTLAANRAASDMLWRLETRRSVAPLALHSPGPTAEQLHRLLTIAARVPDHGTLVPWRFITVQGEARRQLAASLAQLYLAASPAPDSEQARKTAARIEAVYAAPPVIVLVVSCPNAASQIPEWEQVLSAGAACMNLLSAASAMGFAANWLTGWAAYSSEARALMGLADTERLAGFIPIGTCTERPPERPRPALDAVVASWPSPRAKSDRE
jgi:nitroreductase